MRRPVRAVYFDVYETEDGAWDLHWPGDAEPVGVIEWDDNAGLTFEPFNDDWTLDLDELAELAGLLRLYRSEVPCGLSF